METLKFVVVMLVVVLVQVCSALGTPLSGEENDGEMWTVEDWQVQPPPRPLKEKKRERKRDADLRVASPYYGALLLCKV